MYAPFVLAYPESLKATDGQNIVPDTLPIKAPLLEFLFQELFHHLKQVLSPKGAMPWAMHKTSSSSDLEQPEMRAKKFSAHGLVKKYLDGGVFGACYFHLQNAVNAIVNEESDRDKLWEGSTLSQLKSTMRVSYQMLYVLCKSTELDPRNGVSNPEEQDENIRDQVFAAFTENPKEVQSVGKWVYAACFKTLEPHLDCIEDLDVAIELIKLLELFVQKCRATSPDGGRNLFLVFSFYTICDALLTHTISLCPHEL